MKLCSLYKTIFILACLSTRSLLYAQMTNPETDSIGTEQDRDSLSIQKGKSAEIISAPIDSFIFSASEIPYNYPIGINPFGLDLPQLAFPMPVVEKPYLAEWENGILLGSHGNEGAKGLYNANTASIYAIQNFGHLQLSGNVSLSKIASFYNLTNNGALNLSASYPLNRNISITGFGGIYQNGLFATGSRMGYLYGGYISLLTNNGKWGTDLGVRRMYNPFAGVWETIPIFMPYYKLGDSKLGMDFGGLIYHFLQGAKDAKVNRSNPRLSNPTIAPPKQNIEIRPFEVPKGYQESN